MALPSPTHNRSILDRAKGIMEHEPRNKAFAVKILLVTGVLVTPVLVSVALAPVATVAYQERAIRRERMLVTTASLPDWVTYENLTKLGYLSYSADYIYSIVAGTYNPNIDDNPLADPGWTKRPDLKGYAPYTNFGTVVAAVNASMKSSRVPSGYEGVSLYQWLSSNNVQRVIPGIASGMQTMELAFPDQSSQPVALAVLPSSNVLLAKDPLRSPLPNTTWDVPGSGAYIANDFKINQSVLVVDKNCTFGLNYSTLATKDLAEADTLAYWEKRLAADTYFDEYDQGMFMQAIKEGQAKAGRPVIWASTWTSDPSMATYNQTTKLISYYKEVWNFKDGGEEMALYTASPQVWYGAKPDWTAAGMLCKTTISPIVFEANIPAGFSAVTAVGRAYNRTNFTTAARQIVKTAFQLTERVMADMATGNMTRPAANIGGLPMCKSTSLLGDVVTPVGNWTALLTKFQGLEQALVRNATIVDSALQHSSLKLPRDNCAATHFDRHFRSYLSAIKNLASDKKPTTFAWGPLELRYVPNKSYCALLVVLLLVATAVLLLLRWGSYMPPLRRGTVDVTTPWAANLAQLKAVKGSDEQAACIITCDPHKGDITVVPPAKAAGDSTGSTIVHAEVQMGSAELLPSLGPAQYAAALQPQTAGQWTVHRAAGQHPMPQAAGQSPVRQVSGQQPMPQAAAQYAVPQAAAAQYPVLQAAAMYPVPQPAVRYPVPHASAQYEAYQPSAQYAVPQTARYPVLQASGQQPAPQATGAASVASGQGPVATLPSFVH